MWDPLAAVIAVQDGIAMREQVRLRVSQEPGPELGRVVEDPRAASLTCALPSIGRAFEHEYLQAYGPSCREAGLLTARGRLEYDGVARYWRMI